jgi:hypothetical protein
MAIYVPASRANQAGIDALRRQAAGAYRSASYAGAYRLPADEPAPVAPKRSMKLGG